jgi:DNA-binding transcriptional regulator/RsmH inhibitor MraZ
MNPLILPRTLDRGYIRVPPPFQQRFPAGKIYVAYEVAVNGATAVLMTEELLHERLTTLTTRSKESIADRRTWLRFSANASCVTLGSKGRVRLPPQVIASAGLPSRVTVVVSDHVLELWEPTAYTEHLVMARSVKPVWSHESVSVKPHHATAIQWGVARTRLERLLNNVDMLVSQSPTERAEMETIGQELRAQSSTHILTEPALRYLLNALSTDAAATCTCDERRQLQLAIDDIAAPATTDPNGEH